MRILITGAGGFLGQSLVRKLLDREDADFSCASLHALDINLSCFDSIESDKFHRVECSISDSSAFDFLEENKFDFIFHLAGVTSQRAEEDIELGLSVNVSGSINLLEALRKSNHRSTLVFTSSIGVYGVPLPPEVNDETSIAPTLSYGAQKRMIELLVADYSRRGFIDGRTVRLPGVIARPANSIKALSTFSSDILHKLAAGEKFVSPVSEASTNWLISVECCLDQLIHAARSQASLWPATRVVNLPVMRITAGELVKGLEIHLGKKLSDLVEWNPIPKIEAQFGSWPPLYTKAAEKIGFKNDGSAESLVRNALAI